MMKKYLILFLLTCLCSSCKKFLDAKPDGRLILPEDNLQNLKLILDDTFTMNQLIPVAGEVSSDNIVFTDTQWQNLKQSSATSANLYLWLDDVFNDNETNDWSVAYKIVLNTNIVLDAVGTVKGAEVEKDDIKGQALFFRSLAFYHLLQEFSKPYNRETAGTDKGIVLRLTADISERSARATNQKCYEQVIADLQESIKLLKAKATFKTNPCKAAAIGLLARVYLTMGEYGEALSFAKQYLAVSPVLLDYNSIPIAPAFPFPAYNDEVTFHAKLLSITAFGTAYGRVNDDFYHTYSESDLRRVLFFKDGGPGNITFRGSYYGTRLLFGGIATDEIYLIAAECKARLNDIPGSLQYLNTLGAKRYSNASYIPFQANSRKDAIRMILRERRKELVFRNIRWSDVRRLATDPDFKIDIAKSIGGVRYELPAGSPKLVFPIPRKVIELSGIEQN